MDQFIQSSFECSIEMRRLDDPVVPLPMGADWSNEGP